MPIDTSILGGITLPQLRDPQQEAINQFNLQAAQLQQQQFQQRMQTERENAAQATQLNEAMNQAWGFVSQYMDPSTGMIPTERFGEIIQKSGIPGKYASNVINMMKTMNADVIAQRKNEVDWQKVQSDLEDAQKKREANTMATLADQLLAIDDPGARNISFLANLGRLVSNGKVSKNDSQQILSSISNPDGSINPDRMTSVLESVVRMDEQVAAARQAAHKPKTYGAEATWYMVNGKPVLARTSSDGKMVDAYGNVITGSIEPMPVKMTPYQQAMVNIELRKLDTKPDQVQPRSVSSVDARTIASLRSATDLIADIKRASKDTDSSFTTLIAKTPAFANIQNWATDSKTRVSLIELVKQAIAKSLEQGRLSDQDIERYGNMIPTPNDDSKTAIDKINTLQNYLLDQHTTLLDALEDANYDVTKFRARGIGTSLIPQNVTNALKGKQSGTYQLTDGSVWVIEEDGTIRKGGL